MFVILLNNLHKPLVLVKWSPSEAFDIFYEIYQQEQLIVCKRRKIVRQIQEENITFMKLSKQNVEKSENVVLFTKYIVKLRVFFITYNVNCFNLYIGKFFRTSL